MNVPFSLLEKWTIPFSAVWGIMIGERLAEQAVDVPVPALIEGVDKRFRMIGCKLFSKELYFL